MHKNQAARLNLRKKPAYFAFTNIHIAVTE